MAFKIMCNLVSNGIDTVYPSANHFSLEHLHVQDPSLQDLCSDFLHFEHFPIAL